MMTDVTDPCDVSQNLVSGSWEGGGSSSDPPTGLRVGPPRGKTWPLINDKNQWRVETGSRGGTESAEWLPAVDCWAGAPGVPQHSLARVRVRVKARVSPNIAPGKFSSDSFGRTKNP